MILKTCKLCKNEKSEECFYTLNSGYKDSYCKECRKAMQANKNSQKRINAVIELINEYKDFPQFDYTQPHSLAIFGLIDLRMWPVALEYLNETYQTEYNYKDTFIHIKRIRPYIYRFFTFKKCDCCTVKKQTYVNSEDYEYVYEILTNTNIPIVTQDFALSKNSKDGWAQYCKACQSAAKMLRSKRKPINLRLKNSS